MVDKLPLRFAIAGTSRSGKNTFATILNKAITEKGLAPAYELAFADEIKELYRVFFSHLETTEKPRAALVTIGNAFREVDETVWIRALIRKASRLYEDSIIVTDCRYENEADALREQGFTIIKVDADVNIRMERSEALGEHLDPYNKGDLEVDLIHPDYVITNNGEDDFKALPTIAESIIMEVYNEVYN